MSGRGTVAGDSNGYRSRTWKHELQQLTDAACARRLLAACNASRYSPAVIRSFRHKGVQRFFETGSRAGIRPEHSTRLARQLRQPNDARGASDMNVPGWRLHPLTGELTAHWAAWISGNWRLTFAFEGADAVFVDYQDCH